MAEIKFCPTYRDVRRMIKRKALRHILCLLMTIIALLIISGAMNAYDFYDRKVIHADQSQMTEAQKAMVRQAEMTKLMLATRSYNQELLLIENWNGFSIEQKKRILDNWEAAEYSPDGKQYLLSITPEYSK